MKTWDERVRAVDAARRKRREDDDKLFEEIWRYLDERRDEEIEKMQREPLPDGRSEGAKIRRGACAFSYHVHDGKVVVRPGGDMGMEYFDNLETAYQCMAELMCDLKERAATVAPDKKTAPRATRL